MVEHMAAWILLLGIALALGLPLNHTTIFWVGILSIWMVSTGKE